MKPKPCLIIYNTKWGYILQPLSFPSISKALEDAKEKKLAFRIYHNNQCIKHGWFV